MNNTLKLLAGASALVFFATNASAGSIDFTTVAAGTPVTNQYAGVTFSLLDSPTTSTPIVTNVFGGINALTNSDTNYYPTAFTLDAAFSSAASGISFTFNNFGTNDSSPSTWTAYDASHNVVSSGNLADVQDYSWITVAGSGITDLQISNGGVTNWQFGISQFNFTSGAVPEPASWAMMVAGFGLAGAAMRRRKASVAFA
jgi:hypothetical protein